MLDELVTGVLFNDVAQIRYEGKVMLLSRFIACFQGECAIGTAQQQVEVLLFQKFVCFFGHAAIFVSGAEIQYKGGYPLQSQEKLTGGGIIVDVGYRTFVGQKSECVFIGIFRENDRFPS